MFDCALMNLCLSQTMQQFVLTKAQIPLRQLSPKLPREESRRLKS